MNTLTMKTHNPTNEMNYTLSKTKAKKKLFAHVRLISQSFSFIFPSVFFFQCSVSLLVSDLDLCAVSLSFSLVISCAPRTQHRLYTNSDNNCEATRLVGFSLFDTLLLSFALVLSLSASIRVRLCSRNKNNNTNNKNQCNHLTNKPTTAIYSDNTLTRHSTEHIHYLIGDQAHQAAIATARNIQSSVRLKLFRSLFFPV